MIDTIQLLFKREKDRKQYYTPAFSYYDSNGKRRKRNTSGFLHRAYESVRDTLGIGGLLGDIKKVPATVNSAKNKKRILNFKSIISE